MDLGLYKRRQTTSQSKNDTNSNIDAEDNSITNELDDEDESNGEKENNYRCIPKKK